MADYKVVDIEKLEAGLTATANAIREKTGSFKKIQWNEQEGMSLAVDEVFEAGKQEAYDKFWDEYQQRGSRKTYQYAFSGDGWTDDTFKPKYDIVLDVGYTGTYAFWNCRVTNIAERLEQLGVKLDTSKSGYIAHIFQLSFTKRIPMLDCTNAMQHGGGLSYAFTDASVETIDRLIVTEDLTYNSAFRNAQSLKNITFEGAIGQDIDFQWSPLSEESLQSVISHLSDSAAEKTVTFKLSAVNNAFETGEGAADGSASAEWAALIATKPNWTITLV